MNYETCFGIVIIIVSLWAALRDLIITHHVVKADADLEVLLRCAPQSEEDDA